jgi:succinate dehydrogenase / fumarate reductase cytochrome b subunit
VPDPTTTNYRAGRLRALWRTTIGKKYVVAITGVIMAIWLIGHMLGNLKAFGGPGPADEGSSIDHYAEWLREVGAPAIPREGLLWTSRAIIITAVVLHIIAITQLYLRNRNARPPGHRHPPRSRSTIAARTMYVTGPLLLVFVVFHVLHFTTRTIHPTPLLAEQVYFNLDSAFEEWWLVAIYVAASVALGLHLWHSLWSSAQTAGLDNPDRNWFWRRQAAVVTTAMVIGFGLVPVLFLAGVLPDAKTPTTTQGAHR